MKIQVVFDCADPRLLGEFWAEALHYRTPEPPDGFANWDDWARAEGIPEERWNDASALARRTGRARRLAYASAHAAVPPRGCPGDRRADADRRPRWLGRCGAGLDDRG